MRFGHAFQAGQGHDESGICRFGITEAIGAVIASVATGLGAGAAAGTIGTIGTGVLVGAAAGAGEAALTGGKPLVGALTGGLTGGVLGAGAGGALGSALGIGSTAGDAIAGGLTDAAASAALNPKNAGMAALQGGLSGAIGGGLYGAMGAGAPGASSAPSGAPAGATGAGGAGSASDLAAGIASGGGTAAMPVPGAGALANAASTAATSPALATPVSGAPANAGGGLNGLFGGKINGTSLALGGLSALGSLFGKPQQYGGPLVTPAQTQLATQNLGPYYTMPLQTGAVGRSPVSPPPNTNWYTYGSQPEQLFFQGNNLKNFGFHRGGALRLAGGGGANDAEDLRETYRRNKAQWDSMTPRQKEDWQQNRPLPPGWDSLQEMSKRRGGALNDNEFTTGGVSQRVKGKGTWTSDDVKARLSDGEYVLTGDDLARLGNPSNPKAPGANKRGADMLDRDRGALSRLVRQKQFAPDSRGRGINEPMRRRAS
jgi:hypothetical protein